MTVSLDRIAQAFGMDAAKRSDSHIYATVSSVNNDGSYQVILDGAASTVRAAKLCNADANDRVLCIVTASQVIAIGKVGGETFTDANGYRIRTNNATLVAAQKFVRYRLLFTSADGTKWVPANTSTSTSATTSKTVNTAAIDPFAPIVYYSSTSTVNANAKPSVTNLWQQYNIVLGYSFNSTGSALTLTSNAPVYIQCTPQSDGSAKLVGYTQSKPTTNDGKIYILLGIAYDATHVELRLEHPVYYHDGTACRLWTGA